MARTRKNLLYGLLALATTLLIFLRAVGVFPPYVDDLIGRAAPALLVIFGLSLLLRNRVPFGDAVAVLLGGALLAGVTFAAFNVRQTQMRDDNQVLIEESVSEGIILLRVRLQSLDTDVEVVRAAEGVQDTLSARFIGSTESEIVRRYTENPDGTAEFIFSEARINPVPLLENVGRGRLLVELPPDVPVDLQLEAIQGEIRLNLSNVALERLNLNVGNGETLVTLPVYDPLFSEDSETLGTWAVNSGRMLVRVPPDIAARFDMSRSTGPNPDYDPGVYNLLFDRDVLEARNFDNADIIVRYDLIVDRGQLTVDVPLPPDAEADES